MTTVKPLVTRSDDVAWGASVFAGTRVPVDPLFDYRGSDERLDEFLCQFPTVAREQAPGVLEQSRRLAREQAIPA
jgi:uncharacterized protein (DUF433 family)